MSYLWYVYHLDTSAYDEAVSNVNKYRKLLQDVQNHINIANDQQTKIISCMFNTDNTMQAHNSGSQGHVIKFYNGKFEQWQDERKSYWHVMQEELLEAKNRIPVIQNKISSWESARDSAARTLDNTVARIQEEERRRQRELELARQQGR